MRELQSKTSENGPILRVILEGLVSHIHNFSGNKFYKSEIVCQILGQQDQWWHITSFLRQKHLSDIIVVKSINPWTQLAKGKTHHRTLSSTPSQRFNFWEVFWLFKATKRVKKSFASPKGHVWGHDVPQKKLIDFKIFFWKKHFKWKYLQQHYGENWTIFSSFDLNCNHVDILLQESMDLIHSHWQSPIEMQNISRRLVLYCFWGRILFHLYRAINYRNHIQKPLRFQLLSVPMAPWEIIFGIWSKMSISSGWLSFRSLFTKQNFTYNDSSSTFSNYVVKPVQKSDYHINVQHLEQLMLLLL